MSKSVEELFRDAPPDATHYAGYCHYKKVNDVWMVHMYGDEWDKSSSMYNGDIKPADIVRRPQPKPWSGPEDGLPPVGSEVELGRDCILSRFDDFKLFEKGTRVLVGGHANFGGVDVAVIHREYDSQGYTATLCQYLEPIRTPEQLAASIRETAIRELMDIAQVDCRVTAARLVDAGFKREVV